MVYRVPGLVDSVFFDVLGKQDEESDDDGGCEGLYDERGDDGNGHRDLHRDSPVSDRMDGFLVDRDSTEKSGGYCDYVEGNVGMF